jgi:single-stranded-DNA-specific exonuclease
MAWSAARVRYAEVAAIQDALGCPEPLAWTLVRRGLGDPEAAREFLAADGPLDPPEALPGIAEAADRLALAVRRGEAVVVHGDYDCDGITSTTILLQALRARGGRAEAFLPSRFSDGYGVSESTVERLAGEGCRLLVCVDCGTTAVDALTRAAELGIESIVCDHHLAGGLRPPAILANPALGRPDGPLPAAAGVVFKLTRALAARLDGGGLAPPPDDGLDLVALATVADAVPLQGENRRLVARGLAAMRTAPRPGIVALCRAAGIAPRALTARSLGFQLAPCLNASGRLAHAGRGLDLLMAADAAEADPIAAELWALNLERRAVEARILEEALAILDASPSEVREADAIVAAGTGWHEGVVGIVASRLVERYGRPAVVIACDDETGVAKGSGRSLPGVDLHGLVARASGTLTRWGGHAGAVGLQLAPGDVATFRRELVAAAEGERAAIERARVRIVDAVVGGADLGLRGAEALEALAPFGRGNPDVRLAVTGCEVGGAVRVGEGKHLQVRLRAGGAHARAIGFGLGQRAPDLAAGERHDALVRLEVERWQDLVGPRVVLEALEPLKTPGRPVAGLCVQGCDVRCPERRGGGDLRSLLDAPDDAPAPPPAGPPLGVRDDRGRGVAAARIAALAAADGGVVACVSDVAARRAALESVLQPARLGLEVAVLGGGRCDLDALRARLALARGGPLLAMLDYERLAEVEPPAGAHLVLVDPPADPAAAAWASARAAGRWLHLVWGPEEVAVATAAAEREWDLRPLAAELWRALADGARRPWGPGLEALLLGDGPRMRSPRAVARALGVLRDVGLVEVADDGVRAVIPAPRRDLGESLRYRKAQARLAACREMLGRAATIDLAGAAAPTRVPAGS